MKSQSTEHIQAVNSKLELPIISFFDNESTTFKIIVYTIPAFLLICVLSAVVYFAVTKTNLFDGAAKDAENPSPYSRKKFSCNKPDDEQSIINQDEIISVWINKSWIDPNVIVENINHPFPIQRASLNKKV